MMILNRAKRLQMKKQLVYILFLIGVIGFAQENPVSIKIDTTAITIGEQIQFKISVQEKENVVFPKLKLDSLNKIEVVESLPIDTIKNILEKKYLITSFDSGQYVLPKQLVLINNKQFFTDSLLINVATVKVDTLKQKMFPIKSIKKEPKTFDDYKYLLWWLIPILIVLGVILYFIFRKKIKKEAPKVYVAPILEALNRLKELDEKQLLQQNKIKIYYSELTDIVRTYIEKDINIPALESTTNELIDTINDFNESSKLGISKETIQQLKEVLESADLVKFAKSKPLVDEIRNDRAVVEDILKNTQHAVHLNDEKEQELNVNVELQPKPKKKSNLVKYILIFIAVFVVIIGTAGYFGYGYIKENILGDTTSEMMDKQWYTSSYGYPSITIETPEILKAQNIELPENLKSVIEDVTTYNYGSLISNFYIGVTSTSFVNELQDYNFDDAIQGSLNQIAQKVGTSFSDIQQEIRVNNGVEGRIITANYKVMNPATKQLNKNKFAMLLFADTKSMRQVIITQLESDENAEKVRERILTSISLKP
jgi:hypothetical protein